MSNKPISYLTYLKENGYIADDECTSDSYSSDSDSESNTDTDEEESEFLLMNTRSKKEILFILKHVWKHPSNITLNEFECAMCYDRMSNKWDNQLEKLYKKIVKKLTNR